MLASGVALTGCSALIGVNDIYVSGETEGGAAADSARDSTFTDSDLQSDGGAETGPCVADLQNDVKNCGRCGHDCRGGTCAAGKCQAVELAVVANAPFNHIVVSTQHVFVSTQINLTTEVGGLWRVPKSGGGAELYVPASFRYAEQMAIVGDTLYFTVDDEPTNGTTQFGGFYSCPVIGSAPCAPTLLASADSPGGVTTDRGRVFYSDDATGKGWMVYTPGGGAPTVFIDGYGPLSSMFVDGTSAFYSYTTFTSPQRARLIEAYADGGIVERYNYESPTAEDGVLLGSPNALLFTAYDFANTSEGVVRRIPRNGTVLPCSYGGVTNKRPYGLYFDANRIFWTNQGEGAAGSFAGGGVLACDLAGCCAAADELWSGTGQPTALTGDADAVYWVTRSGSGVWKVAKP